MISKFQDFINEDTSATGGSSVSGSVPSAGGVALANTSISGMGPVQSSQPSGFPGALNGANWINGGGESGSGDISVPYNPSGANRMFQKIPSPMGKNHGSKTGKKSRTKKLDLKSLRDVLKNRPKSGSGKIMNFDNFAKKDIITRVTKVKESVEIKESGISTNSVWVVMGYGDTSIDRIFLSENEAKMAAESENLKWREYRRNIHKNMTDDEFEEYFKFESRFKKRHMTLDNAIDEIKDNIDSLHSEREAGEDY